MEFINQLSYFIKGELKNKYSDSEEKEKKKTFYTQIFNFINLIPVYSDQTMLTIISTDQAFCNYRHSE